MLKQPLTSYRDDELLIHIFSFLHPIHVLRYCSQVSRQWYNLATADVLWLFFLQTYLKIDIRVKDKIKLEWDFRKVYFTLLQSKWRWRRGVGRTNYDHHFKVMLLGDKKTGKSSLLMRLVKENLEKETIKKLVSKYEMSWQNTYMVDVVNNDSVKLQIYDSNIVELTNYVKACRQYASFCHALVIVFNLANKRSFFNAVNKWTQMIRRRNPGGNIILVGNKCDIPPEKRAVTRKEIEAATQQNGIPYFEVSSLAAFRTEDLLQSITNIIYGRLEEARDTETLLPDVMLKDTNLKIGFYAKVLPVPKPETIDLAKYSSMFTDGINEEDHSEAEDDDDPKPAIDDTTVANGEENSKVRFATDAPKTLEQQQEEDLAEVELLKKMVDELFMPEEEMEPADTGMVNLNDLARQISVNTMKRASVMPGTRENKNFEITFTMNEESGTPPSTYKKRFDLLNDYDDEQSETNDELNDAQILAAEKAEAMPTLQIGAVDRQGRRKTKQITKMFKLNEKGEIDLDMLKEMEDEELDGASPTVEHPKPKRRNSREIHNAQPKRKSSASKVKFSAKDVDHSTTTDEKPTELADDKKNCLLQ